MKQPGKFSVIALAAGSILAISLSAVALWRGVQRLSEPGSSLPVAHELFFGAELEETDEEADEEYSKADEEIRRQLGEFGTIRDFKSVIDAEISDCRDLQADFTEEGAVALQLIIDYLELNSVLVQEKEAATKEFKNLGGVNPATITSREDIDVRLDSIARAREKITAVNDQIDSNYATLEIELAALSIADEIERAFIDDFFAETDDELIERVVELYFEVMKMFESRLRILDEEWGNWKSDSAGGIEVESEFARENLDEYNRLGAEIRKLVTEQQPLVRTYFISE